MAPVNCVVRNNLATSFSNAAGVRQENNLKIQNPAALFVDPARFDLHLLPGAAAIDAGSSLNAPKLDRDRIPRPQGKGIDIGAYEWHAEMRPVENSPAGNREEPSSRAGILRDAVLRQGVPRRGRPANRMGKMPMPR